jgi:hypothetical protein
MENTVDYIFYPETGELVRLHHGRPDGDLETAPELVARAYLRSLHAALAPAEWQAVVAGESPDNYVDSNQLMIDALGQCSLGMMAEPTDEGGLPDCLRSFLCVVDRRIGEALDGILRVAA